MSRSDFMRELEGLLSDIPVEERKEALKYYNDYFEDAGEEHEEEIIKELGSPSRIAGIIKADIKADGSASEERGYFTERGFQDTVYEDEKFEIVKPELENKKDNAGAENKSTQSNPSFGGSDQGGQGFQGGKAKQADITNILLLILLCVFAIPVGLPLFFSVLGIVIAAVATVAALLFGFGIAGFVMVPSGIALIFAGIVKMGIPFLGLGLCGAGLLLLGIGMLFILLSAWLCKKALPAIIRGIVNLCRLPFKNRSVAV